MSIRYIICFEYLGHNFFGSQKQPDKRTVQGELEKALCTLTKDKIKIFPSGRTDAKVSAEYQCAHFDCEVKISDNDKFLNSLNSILPDDLKVFELRETKPGFHAQKDAKFKHYRYTIDNTRVASVFSNCSLHYPYFELDIERINSSLSNLIGHHDFSAFKSKSDNPYNDCTIYYIKAKKVKKGRNNFIFIDIIGDRFLYNMVRIIVGSVIYIEKNKLKPETMKEILNLKHRIDTINTIDAKGLCLMYAGYSDVNDYIKKFIKEGNNENIQCKTP